MSEIQKIVNYVNKFYYKRSINLYNKSIVVIDTISGILKTPVAELQSTILTQMLLTITGSQKSGRANPRTSPNGALPKAWVKHFGLEAFRTGKAKEPAQ